MIWLYFAIFVAGYLAGHLDILWRRWLARKRDSADNLKSGYYLDEEPDFAAQHRAAGKALGKLDEHTKRWKRKGDRK